MYLIQCGDYVKIGVARSLGKRLMGLQCGTPYDLKLLGAVRGDYALERELHRKFEMHAHRGEWFINHPEILEWFLSQEQVEDDGINTGRVQLDLAHWPADVVAHLRKLAAGKGLSLGVYCRTVLIEHALRLEKR